MTRLAVIAVTLTMTSIASATTTEECIAADTGAQSLKRAGMFRAAREQLALCTSEACPRMVRDDCNQRLDELNRLTPSIVFAVKDAGGHDLTAVKVSIDGVASASIAGSAIELDPGDHEFAFELTGHPVFHAHYVLREGERDRHESITIRQAATAPVEAPPTPSASDATSQPEVVTKSSDSPTVWRTIGWIVAGVGLASVGVGVALGVLGNAKNESVLSDCPTGGCVVGTTQYDQSVSDRDSAQNLYVGAVVAIVGGGAAVLGGVLCAVLAPKKTLHASTARIVPALLRGGGAISITGSF